MSGNCHLVCRRMQRRRRSSPTASAMKGRATHPSSGNTTKAAKRSFSASLITTRLFNQGVLLSNLTADRYGLQDSSATWRVGFSSGRCLSVFVDCGAAPMSHRCVQGRIHSLIKRTLTRLCPRKKIVGLTHQCSCRHLNALVEKVSTKAKVMAASSTAILRSPKRQW